MSTKQQTYLGIDLGAESGRVMAGHWDGKTMQLEELHRFPNGANRNRVCTALDNARWVKCRMGSPSPHSVSVIHRFDRRGPRGALIAALPKTKEMLGTAVHPSRWAHAWAARGRVRKDLAQKSSRKAARSSWKSTRFLQLLALQRDHPEILDATDCFLMIPGLHQLVPDRRARRRIHERDDDAVLSSRDTQLVVRLLKTLELPGAHSAADPATGNPPRKHPRLRRAAHRHPRRGSDRAGDATTPVRGRRRADVADRTGEIGRI
jgi:hypothetical protein